MDDKKLLETVKIAIGIEDKGYAVYKGTAGKTKNPLVKATFNALAARELEHKERFMQIYEQFSGGEFDEEWLRYVSGDFDKKELVTGIMDQLRNKLANLKLSKESDTLKAYEAAMGLERESFDFYQRSADQINDPLLKKFFLAIADEENEHYAVLQESITYLETPGDWFKEQERWIVEG